MNDGMVKLHDVRCWRCTPDRFRARFPLRLCVTLTRKSAESVALAHRLRTLHASTVIMGRYHRPEVAR